MATMIFAQGSFRRCNVSSDDPDDKVSDPPEQVLVLWHRLGQHIQDSLEYSPGKCCCWILFRWETSQVWGCCQWIWFPALDSGYKARFWFSCLEKNLEDPSVAARSQSNQVQYCWWKDSPKSLVSTKERHSLLLSGCQPFVWCHFGSWAEDELRANGLYYCFP